MAKRESDWRLPYADKFITGHFGTLSEFRKARNMQAHSGTDWARPLGTRIPAIAKGTVRLVQFSKVLGWVLVQSAMDKDGVVWYLGYCHMDSKPGYEVGQVLAKGQTVGLIGSTGVSSGPHLHATASKTLKGVFGATSEKSDLYKLILANTKGTETEQENTQAQAVVQPQTIVKEKLTTVYACPHCKKELK
jgi:murein DD-endopeptidase MepM/ murein hydrolase activator NlpD